MRRLIGALVLVLGTITAIPSQAADRAAVIHSRINSSLANILDKSDYLILVNRLDELEESAVSDMPDGALKSLPGLNVGVDAKGRVVRQDAGAADYTGAVSVSLVLDRTVRPETAKLIEARLPEIIGGLKDSDELKVTRAGLRQPARANSASPAVTVNNVAAPSENKTSQDNLKFMAVLLIATGLLVWVLGRFGGRREGQNPGSPGQRPEPMGPIASRETAERGADLSELDAFASAIYVLKALKEGRSENLQRWIDQSTLKSQRAVFAVLPGWASAYIDGFVSRLPHERKTQDPVVAASIYREIAVIEQSLRSEHDRRLAFLTWFPAQGLRYVPKAHQQAFSQKDRHTLWHFRPDLGDFVRATELETAVGHELSKDDVKSCFDSLMSWPSSSLVKEPRTAKGGPTPWIQAIHLLNEFGPVASQLEQARLKLNDSDFATVWRESAHLESPLSWDEANRRAWLRQVDPQDYQWWKSLLKKAPDWSLEKDLRPLRLAMFRFAENQPAFQSWSEQEKKESAARILQSMRAVLRGEGAEVDVAA